MLQEIIGRINDSIIRIADIANKVWELLTFSFFQEYCLIRKKLYVSLMPRSLVFAYGIKFLGRIQCRRVKSFAVDEDKHPSPETIAACAIQALNDFGVQRVSLILGIPKAWVVMQTVEFPSAAKEDLPGVIAYELDRITPFSAEDAYCDFRILREAEGHIEVLVIAARLDRLDPYLGALEGRGLAVESVTVDLFSRIYFLKHFHKAVNGIVLQVDSDHYDLINLERGECASILSDEMHADESLNIDTLHREIYFRKNELLKQGILPQLFLLESSLPAGLENRLPLPVKAIGKEECAVLCPEGKAASPAALGGLLASLATSSFGPNLLCRSNRKVHKTPLFATAGLTLALLMIGIVYLAAPIHIEKEKIGLMDREIKRQKDEVKTIETMAREIEAVKAELAAVVEFKEKSPSLLMILRELTVNLPKTVWLSRVRISENKADIEGYAASSPSNILSKLEASQYLRKVEFASPTTKDPGMGADRFAIRMELESPQQLPTEVIVKDEKAK